MELQTALEALKLDKAKYLPVIEPNWEKSEASFPAGIPEFLTPAVYRDKYKCTGLDPAILPVLDDISAKIVNNPALLHLAWHCYQSQFVYPNPAFANWPWFEEVLGENSTVFYLLVMIATFPLVIRKYREKGIPEEYAAAICSRIRGYYDTYKAGYNRHGMNPAQLYWSRLYVDCVLFRVGRFEYWARPFKDKYNIEVYRNNRSGKILTLMTKDRHFTQDGNCLCHDEDPATAAFAADYVKTDEYVIGPPANPEGNVANFNVKLDLKEWTLMFSPEDICLELHIPEGGKMTLDVCKQSFKDGLAFYKQYFPEMKISAFVCASWIFSPLYEKVLPESNLAAFMRELYLVPWTSAGTDGFYFIFGRNYDKQSSYSRDNSVRRTMLDQLEAGRRLHTGGMFCLAEHVDLLGRQPYRTMFKVEDLKSLAI